MVAQGGLDLAHGALVENACLVLDLHAPELDQLFLEGDFGGGAVYVGEGFAQAAELPQHRHHQLGLADVGELACEVEIVERAEPIGGELAAEGGGDVDAVGLLEHVDFHAQPALELEHLPDMGLDVLLVVTVEGADAGRDLLRFQPGEYLLAILGEQQALRHFEVDVGGFPVELAEMAAVLEPEERDRDLGADEVEWMAR